MVVGCIYKQPDLLVEYGRYVRSKYDFYDECARFFYDCASIIYETRSQTFEKSTIVSFMTEDNQRLAEYKKHGGWKTIDAFMRLAVVEDFKQSFDVLKKFSLLREYQNRGFAVEKIMTYKKFDTLTADDIYRMVRTRVDTIKTVILEESKQEILNSGTEDTILNCLEHPDIGIPFPFGMLTELFRGQRPKQMMAMGMLSNAGKSRLLCKIIAYDALVQKQTVLVLLNEMSISEFRFCLITTIINNPEFQNLHGIKLNKKEREITLGMYHDDNGNFIERYHDSEGNYTESLEDYCKRLNATSDEFRKVRAITQWIDKESEGKIICKNVQSSYEDEDISFEIRRAALVSHIQGIFYDTLKPQKSSIDDWGSFKRLVTTLSELAKEIGVFLLVTYQLTDDTALIAPTELTTNNIASSKQIQHLLDGNLAFAEIKKKDYGKYSIRYHDEDWGDGERKLDLNKRYYVCNVLKNRSGNKPKLIFSLNLDYNTWDLEGEVVNSR